LTKNFLKFLDIDFDEDKDIFDLINNNKLNIEESSSVTDSEENLNFFSTHPMISMFIILLIIIISGWLIIKSQDKRALTLRIFDTNAVLVNTYRMVSEFYAFLETFSFIYAIIPFIMLRIFRWFVT
jgi:hypothetical protein